MEVSDSVLITKP